jgi:hypothetical protein
VIVTEITAYGRDFAAENRRSSLNSANFSDQNL